MRNVVLAGLFVSAGAHGTDLPVGTDKAICRPQFQTTAGPLSAGTAFVLEAHVGNAKALLVTAHHLFGPPGGLENQLSWQELPAKVKGATCTFLAAGETPLTVAQPLAIRNARPLYEEGAIRDMAAFPVMSVPAHVLELAQSVPNVGDSV
jgi:hypothetical protein